MGEEDSFYDRPECQDFKNPLMYEPACWVPGKDGGEYLYQHKEKNLDFAKALETYGLDN